MMATMTRRLGLADHGRTMTLEDFRDAEEEPGYHYELARGVLEVTEVPNDPHGQVVWNLYAAIRDYQRDHPGIVQRSGGGSEFRLWLPGMISGRNPDVAVVLRNAPRDDRNRRIPVLAIEVVSESGRERDYRVKREEYLAYGLLEYWIVDPIARRVTLLNRRGDVWGEQVFEGSQAIASLVLPGLAATVDSLWLGTEEDDEETPDA